MISHYIAVGAGGALGAMARVALKHLLPTALAGIPLQIIVANGLGCFVMGILTEVMALHWSAPDHLKYFVISGFLSSFTTFSGFALEVSVLVERNDYGLATLYMGLSFFLSVGSLFLGMKFVKLL